MASTRRPGALVLVILALHLAALSTARAAHLPFWLLACASTLGLAAAAAAVALGRRRALTAARFRMLWGLALSSACGIGAYALHTLGGEPQPFVFFELTRKLCLRGGSWDLFDLFLVALCPLWLFFDLIAGFGYAAQAGARLVALGLVPVAVFGLAIAVRELVREGEAKAGGDR